MWVIALPQAIRAPPVGPYRARTRDRDLYAQIFGITSPSHVSDVRLDVPAGTVEVVVEHRG